MCNQRRCGLRVLRHMCHRAGAMPCCLAALLVVRCQRISSLRSRSGEQSENCVCGERRVVELMTL